MTIDLSKLEVVEQIRETTGRAVSTMFVLVAMLAGCSPRPAAYTEPLTGMKFALIPAGEFTMGSPPGEPSRQADETPHRVRITRAFYMSETEVTQRQWLAVMRQNPSTFGPPGSRLLSSR